MPSKRTTRRAALILRALCVGATLALASCGSGERGAGHPAAPQIEARSAVVLDASSGRVLFGLKATERRPVASLVKLMVAQVVLSSGGLSREVPATRYRPASPDESLMGLRAGERIRIDGLLRGMLIASGNDAAETLALRSAGSSTRFVSQMNTTAAQLGLSRTHYANATGLDAPGSFSTAADLAQLARRLLRNAWFARTVRTRRTRVAGSRGSHLLSSTNTLLGTGRAITGVKTGHTAKAGYSLVASGKQGARSVIVVVLGEPDLASRDIDALALLRFGWATAR